jgi:flavin-dependent dehydrogenase
VRRAIGAPRGRWTAQVVEVDTPALPDEPGDVLHFDLADRALHGYAWDFPTLVAGAPLVCRGAYALQADPGTDGAAHDPDVGALLRARLDRLGVGAGVRIKRFAERGLSLAEPIARPRVLLVGEAAGIDPALGEGIAQAIAYGAVAGPFLAGAIDRDDFGFAGWPDVLRRSRLGLDLRLRGAFTPWLYDRARPLVEAWAAGSRDLAIAGMRYWAGDRVPRLRLLGAALSGAKIAISRRRGPWW